MGQQGLCQATVAADWCTCVTPQTQNTLCWLGSSLLDCCWLSMAFNHARPARKTVSPGNCPTWHITLSACHLCCATPSLCMDVRPPWHHAQLWCSPNQVTTSHQTKHHVVQAPSSHHIQQSIMLQGRWLTTK